MPGRPFEGWRQNFPSSLPGLTAASGTSRGIGLFTTQVSFAINPVSGTVFTVPYNLPVNPQIVIATISGRTENVETSNRIRRNKGIGAAIKAGPLQPITQICIGSNSDDNAVLTGASDAGMLNALVCTLSSGLSNQAVLQGLLQLQSIDSGIATFKTAQQFDLAYIVDLHLIGGLDITRLDLRQYTRNAGTGLDSRTDPGFKPDFILFFGGHTSTGFGPGNIIENDNSTFIGAADANLNQWVCGSAVNDAGGGGVGGGGRSMSYMRSGECITHWNSSVTGFDTHASLNSVDPLGFTLNWQKSLTDRNFIALCVQGGNWAVGNFQTQVDTAEHQVVNSLNFQPDSEFFFSACKPISTYDTIDANDQLSMGMAKGNSLNQVQYTFGQNVPLPPPSPTRCAQGSAISFNQSYYETTMSGVALSKFGVSSVQNNGFSITHTLAYSGINFVGYFACAHITIPAFQTVIKTIKPNGGGDYPTLVSGLATEIFNHQNLVSQNIVLEFDCYPGIELHTDDNSLIIHGWNEISSANGLPNVGYKTDPTHYIVIKCINGHKGLFDASGNTYLFDFVSPTGNQNAIVIRNEFVRFQQFQVRVTGVSGTGGSNAFAMSSTGLIPPTEAYFINTIAKGVLLSGASYNGFLAGGAGFDRVGVKATFINCIAYDFLNQDLTMTGFNTGNANNPDIRFYNCTAVNCNTGFQDHNDVTFVNCLAIGCDNGWNHGGGIFLSKSSLNNFSTRGPTGILSTVNQSGTSGYLAGVQSIGTLDARGTNSINGVPIFVANPLIEDIRPISGDPYLNNGVNAEFLPALSFTTDVAGNQRTGVWTIGAFQNTNIVQTQSVLWMIVGGVHSTTAKITVKFAFPSSATYLKVSTHSDMSSSTLYGPIATTPNNTAIFSVNVTPNVTNYYQAVIGGSPIGPIQSFQGFPFENSPTSFVFGCGGCSETGSNSNIYNAVAAKNPLLFVNYGDLYYMNVNVNNISLYRTAFDTAMLAPKQKGLYDGTILDWMWDDHDSGQDNGDSTGPEKPAAQSFYRENFPAYTLPDPNAIYHSFIVGRCRFILTDLRSERDPNGNADGSSHTMISATQLAWFKNELALAKSNNQIAFWFSTVPWTISGSSNNNTTSDGNNGDSWGGFFTQRQTISNYIQSLNYQNIIIFCGDMHAAVIDDGTHDIYNSDGTGNHLTMFLPYPLNQTTQIYSGTWTQGPITHVGTRLMGFAGIVTVTDPGGSTVTVKMDVINEIGTQLTFTKNFTMASGTGAIDQLTGIMTMQMGTDHFKQINSQLLMSGTLSGGH
jgi:alkaline phosphatase D